jgi:hypothetical protein
MTALARRGGGFAPALLFLCLLPLSTHTSDQPTSHDGKWWLSIGERQRLGFVDGFEICYVYLVDSNTHLNKPFTLRLALTKYLQDHPESGPQQVESTLLKVNTQLPVKRPSTHPNETPEERAAKWGAHNDGFDWRGPDTFNLGYIQGFLECYSKHTKQEYGTFSKLPEWYVKAIADWYGTGPDPGQINLRREKEKIPEVLFRFRDK